jgi:hypothetical protein
MDWVQQVTVMNNMSGYEFFKVSQKVYVVIPRLGWPEDVNRNL